MHTSNQSAPGLSPQCHAANTASAAQGVVSASAAAGKQTRACETQELKGAAWSTIAAFARRAEFAPALWERLLQVRSLSLCSSCHVQHSAAWILKLSEKVPIPSL